MTIADLASVPFERPADLTALCSRVGELADAEQPFVLLAGGTDWMVEQELRKPFAAGGAPQVLDVSRLARLHELKLEGDVLSIGAGVSYWQLRNSAEVRAHAPLIERMSRDVGAIQIQARGTLGGNLATGSPAADGVAALAAYDAVIVVQSRRGVRRIPMSELQTGYKASTRERDEVIVAIELLLPGPGTHWYWRKVGTRRAQAISKVALGAIARVEAGQVVRCGFGMASVAPVTALLPRTRELFLSSKLATITPAALDKAVESDVSPIDDVRSTGEYRLHVAKAVVRDFARELGVR